MSSHLYIKQSFTKSCCNEPFSRFLKRSFLLSNFYSCHPLKISNGTLSKTLDGQSRQISILENCYSVFFIHEKYAHPWSSSILKVSFSDRSGSRDETKIALGPLSFSYFLCLLLKYGTFGLNRFGMPSQMIFKGIEMKLILFTVLSSTVYVIVLWHEYLAVSPCELVSVSEFWFWCSDIPDENLGTNWHGSSLISAASEKVSQLNPFYRH